MELIGYPDPDYIIRGKIKDTRYINKYSAVYDLRDSLHLSMGVVTIYVQYDTFLNFTLCAPQVCFALDSVLYIFPV